MFAIGFAAIVVVLLLALGLWAVERRTSAAGERGA